MIRVFPTCIASLVLGTAPVVAAAAEAAPAVFVDVDVSALPDDDVTQALAARMVEHQKQTLREGGLEVADDAETKIHIVVSRYGDKGVHYQAIVTLLEADGDEAAVERTLTCELCRDSELIAKVGEEIARLSGRVLYAPRIEEEEAEPELAEPEPETTDPPVNEQPKRLGTLGYVGIGSLVAGSGTLGTGIVLAVLSDQARIEGTQVESRSTRTPGLAMVGVGSALLLAGAVLVTFDGIRRNKQRKVSLAPTVTPSRVTLGMHMRF